MNAPKHTTAIASATDEAGTPLHRGWAPSGGRRRWMEPYVLGFLAGGRAHGYAIITGLAEIGLVDGSVDVGQVYRTLRELEQAGCVESTWSTEPTGPQRREYRLTDAGRAALDQWSAVMRERTRLIAEFDALYMAAVNRPAE